jgi:hypothetical protein
MSWPSCSHSAPSLDTETMTGPVPQEFRFRFYKIDTVSQHPYYISVLLPQFSDVPASLSPFGLAPPLSPFGLALADYAAYGRHV